MGVLAGFGVGPLLSLGGIILCLIITPISMVREYRRQLAAQRSNPAIPAAQVESGRAKVARAGDFARNHSFALRQAIARRLLPGWALSLLLLLAGVYI